MDELNNMIVGDLVRQCYETGSGELSLTYKDKEVPVISVVVAVGEHAEDLYEFIQRKEVTTDEEDSTKP